MTFATAPMVVDTLNIYMVASTATDARYDVEYFFENITTTNNSGWQSSRIWSQKGLLTGATYQYRLKARDTSPQTNETGWVTNSVHLPATYPGLLIDADFEVPYYNDSYANPFFVGWQWHFGSQVYAMRDVSDGVPDGPTNQVIRLNNTDEEMYYNTGHAWSGADLYELTVYATPNQWNGSLQRYLEPSLRESGGTTLWSTNVPVPLYDNFGGNPWTSNRIFNFTIDAKNFSTGTPGEELVLWIDSTGSNSLYIDNVRLNRILPSGGSIFRFR
jgi:hypothetical protein